ncbi:purine nucleotide binding protein (nucleomorph) [Chroomonas mesostigmatica CCMP1168]|uniref:GPN-loop GTPase 3 n=1 Tax=Chroomonas mesostigmatica CCMP1168 TaxID=1195612 RepID=J7G159_9CRYP|nr:purine nucleotide binding protein [Chroomonas mesostigmatica CCMP1168]|mmetsp:Transcript_65912/g.162235  ORF Transcript_65912/g.162235 Transcript_65912/m.162235 type:complete len:254 (+) Transcript_65912:220-981(+)
MTKTGQIVMGPAGCGKSTYCLEIYKNTVHGNGSMKVINLDPSIENIEYPDSVDIRNLIKIEDVMEEFLLGPNGALIFCLEYLMDNLSWFEKELSFSLEKDLIFDLPGQIELYTHCGLIRDFIEYLKKTTDLRIIGLFFLDCQFIGDLGKFFGGSITALSCMLSLEIPHFNILSKMDLVKHIPYAILEKFLFPGAFVFFNELEEIVNSKYKMLTKSLINLLEDFSMIQFFPLDLTQPDSIRNLFQFLNFNIENY